MKSSIDRRSFMKSAGLSAAAATIVPRHVLGRGHVAPSDKLNIGVIGAGGMGANNALRLLSENLVALCDVDFDNVYRGFMQDGVLREDRAEQKAAYDKATKYSDFRVMLDSEAGNIDAVVVATPDHVHAVAAAKAMGLGKHVYVQKPLTFMKRAGFGRLRHGPVS